MTVTENVIPTPASDGLDRRIIAALQVNGRAGWRQIAGVLDAPERTVAAHGAELIRRGTVRLTGFSVLPRGGVLEDSIVSVRSTAGMYRVTAAAAADRPDSVFTYLTTGDMDCVFELLGDRQRLRPVLLDELPAIPGTASLDSATVLKLYKGTHEWYPGILTDEQIWALSDDRDRDHRWKYPVSVELPPLSREEQEIARVLATDGRATIEELARVTALSPASARRRLAHLHESGRLFNRAVVEPDVIGFPVEAILRVRTLPGRTESVARILQRVPEIRYLAFTTGKHQLFVDIACVSHDALTTFLLRTDWTAEALEVETSMVIRALKRSGVRNGP